MSKSKALDSLELHSHPLPKVADGDKKAKGRILVVAGSRNVPGAALLTATAAMRAGAGQLHVVTVDSVAVPLGVAMPEAMVSGVAETSRGGFAATSVKTLADYANSADAVVAGPGMAPSSACRKIASALSECDAQLAFDAALLKNLPLPSKRRARVPILLPHSGELAALLNCSEMEVLADPIGCGLLAARNYNAIVLVKGVSSHVVTPDGEIWTYSGGSPGLGVSGSGDVLAGIVGGFLARGAEPLNALLWSVWLHGEAGARLAKKVGSLGFLAREIASEIPGLLPG